MGSRKELLFFSPFYPNCILFCRLVMQLCICCDHYAVHPFTGPNTPNGIISDVFARSQGSVSFLFAPGVPLIGSSYVGALSLLLSDCELTSVRIILESNGC